MPIVTIKLFSGRSKEVKKKIAKEITNILAQELNIPKEAVIIIFEDIERSNFAQAGELAEESS